MQESFLHFVWKFQYFNYQGLITSDGDSVVIRNQGNYQENSGPDFENCRVIIEGIEWIGNIEVHLRSSDWNNHKHQLDNAFKNVILHVVWENDKDVFTSNEDKVPTIELKGRIDEKLFLKYQSLINAPNLLACGGHLGEISDLKLFEMIDKSVARRLERKSNRVLECFEANGRNWEETAYVFLARNFGFNLNSDSFEQLSNSLSYRCIRKHADHLIQLEAMLFGVAGFLKEENDDEYFKVLKKEYKFLGQKYHLFENEMSRFQWKFLRLRPANFPTIRIAQFANLISGNSNIFSLLINTESIQDLFKNLKGVQSLYWRDHYDFGKAFNFKSRGLGKKSLENIIINTVVPILVAYGRYKQEQSYMDRALNFLESLPTEDNKILRIWKDAGFKAKSSFDSQGLLGQYNESCKARKCLSCSIGADLLNRSL